MDRITLLAMELHKEYRAADKALNKVERGQHDHGWENCHKKKYFLKRAERLDKSLAFLDSISCNPNDTRWHDWAHLCDNLQDMIMRALGVIDERSKPRCLTCGDNNIAYEQVRPVPVPEPANESDGYGFGV